MIETVYRCLYQTGVSPLYIAAQNGHKELAELLLKDGAAVDLQTEVLALSRLHCGGLRLSALLLLAGR